MQLRLAVELLGPLRREFRFLSDVVSQYYSTIDRGIDVALNTVSTAHRLNVEEEVLSRQLIVFLPPHSYVFPQGHNVQPYVMNKWTLPLLAPFVLLFIGGLPFIGVARK